MRENIIELKNVKKTYYLGEVNVSVLHGIDLEIAQGEFVMIMGNSGSGKSTLLNILGLLDKATSGYFKLAGIDVSTFKDDELSALRNHYLGFVFQQFHLLPKLSSLENVALPTIYSDIKNLHSNSLAKTLLDKVGLSDRANHKPNQMSGGQQQRVAIARALINNPIVVFADEPTGNLDTKSSQEIMQILKQLNDSGITIIMVTHEPELKKYASRIITLRDGLIVNDEKNTQKVIENSDLKYKKFKKHAFSLLRFKDYCLEAGRSLIANKMRSALSILGVMIGVASLIAM
ncbi:MAG: ABC transporter ATP-binding protein [Elusimicrobiota bacterium]|jgi:macrolide transport system ATP-binding/permease protein|nr:ABC transporter ATP-binding protein [Elusimicrobiota bacterium]